MKKAIYTCEGFNWDDGNSDKNWYLHHVTDGECEQVFFNLPLVVAPDTKHSRQESRLFVLGRTDAGRWLFIAFVIRENRIRVISARDMNEREAKKYVEHVKRYTGLQE
ncbi:MAG: BrnT family toxin [Anaerolineae bacterium]